MSITILTDVFCDGCRRWTYGIVGGRAKTKEARIVAKNAGWTRRRCEDEKLKDYCPTCSKRFKKESSDG